jgi:hypothetical protein
MLDHDERHAGLGRQVVEEPLERIETSRRGADADDVGRGHSWLIRAAARVMLAPPGTAFPSRAQVAGRMPDADQPGDARKICGGLALRKVKRQKLPRALCNNSKQSAV